MDTKTVIKSQYHASLEMLRQAVAACPPNLWNNPAQKNKYWHIAYHGLFYTHFYLHSSEKAFQPWPKHRREATSLELSKTHEPIRPYTKEEILEYHQYLSDRVDEMVDAIDLEGESGFYWLPFNKLELQLYNIRHLMQHTGELAERLWAVAGLEINWVGMGPKEKKDAE